MIDNTQRQVREETAQVTLKIIKERTSYVEKALFCFSHRIPLQLLGSSEALVS